jgi:hypothetical protein
MLHLDTSTVPQDHVARHAFLDAVFLQRHGEWWQNLLLSCREQIKTCGASGSS